MSTSEIPREDIIILLASMGVDLPKNTKIPDDRLDALLAQTLDASQRLTDLIDVPFNPSNRPKWKSFKTLLEAVSKGNQVEAFENAMSGKNTPNRPVSKDKKDTFREVRQILLGFSARYDQGQRAFTLLDELAEWCVVVKVSPGHTSNYVDEIRFIDAKLSDRKSRLTKKQNKPKAQVPAFALLYKTLHKTSKTSLHDRMGKMFDRSIVSISTTELERKTILKVFALNTKRVSPGYKPPRAALEGAFHLKFLLPMGPLGMRDLGKLSNPLGCEICGGAVSGRCTQCLTVSYCSTESQRADWGAHKARCHSLKGGTWHTLTFGKDEVSPGQVGGRAIINRYDTAEDARSRIEPVKDGPPVSIHGDKAILLKFQIALYRFRDDASMLIYDRQKSFQIPWRKREDREVFVKGQKAMTGSLKIYRWARRVGDYQLSVCFDRAPEKDPLW